MKVFQILDGLCHWQAPYQSVSQIPTDTYAPYIIFVDAPDCVREGWGYDETAEGDARFIKPEPPEGWEYDDATGTFYPVDPTILAGLTQENRAGQTREELEARIATLQGELRRLDGVKSEEKTQEGQEK